MDSDPDNLWLQLLILVLLTALNAFLPERRWLWYRLIPES